MKSWGVLGFQAKTLHELAFVASRIQKAADLPYDESCALLESVPGIGAWTVGMAGLQSLGHPDAVPLGDYNLPSLLAWRLEGREGVLEASLEQQEAWLAPWKGNRGRLLKLLWATGGGPKRRYAKAAMRSLED